MKKITVLVILLLVFVFLLSACSSTDGTIQSPSNVTSNNDGENDKTNNDILPNDDTEGAGDTDVDVNADGEKTKEDTDPAQPVESDVTIEELVLVEEEGIRITAKSLLDGVFGPEVKLLIENDSGKDLTFQTRNSSVNGYMIDAMMSVDVVSGKKANDTLTFMSSELEACGITEIADMEFAFHIFTTEDWETYLETDTIRLETSIVGTYEYTYDDSGDLAYEGNDIRIIVKGLAEDDSIFGPSIIVYIENKSGENITVQTRDVSINGFMVDGMFSCDVNNGKHAIDGITFMSDDLEENDITVIENVELSFHIYQADNWDTIVDTEVISIEF